MYLKRGQVTIFIIIGIVAVMLSAGIILMVNQSRRPRGEDIPEDVAQDLSVNEIRNYVENCLEEAGKGGIYMLAMQGGFLNPSGNPQYGEPGNGAYPGDYYYFANSKLPYLVSGEEGGIRSREDIEKMLSNYVIVETGRCVSNLKAFNGRGLTMEFPELRLANDKVNADVLIHEESVNIKLDWPLNIEKDGQSADLENFRTTLDFRLGRVHGIAERVVADVINNRPLDIMESCDEYVGDDKNVNLYVDGNDYNYNYVIRIIDSKPLERGEMPLKFQFAVRNREIFGECIG